MTVRNNHAPAMRVNVASSSRCRNWTFEGNVNKYTLGNPSGWAWTFKRVDGLRVAGNHQPLQAGRDMHLVGLLDCTDVLIEGNTYPGGLGEVREAQ